MSKAFQWFVAIGVVLFLYVRVTGSNLLFASLIYSVILLGCYVHLIRVPEQKARPDQKR